MQLKDWKSRLLHMEISTVLKFSQIGVRSGTGIVGWLCYYPFHVKLLIALTLLTYRYFCYFWVWIFSLSFDVLFMNSIEILSVYDKYIKTSIKRSICNIQWLLQSILTRSELCSTQVGKSKGFREHISNGQ